MKININAGPYTAFIQNHMLNDIAKSCMWLGADGATHYGYGLCDSNGYPTTIFGTGNNTRCFKTMLRHADANGLDTSGTWTIKYKGTGNLAASLSMVMDSGPTFDGVDNVMTCHFIADDITAFLDLTSTGAPPNHLHDLRIIRPGGVIAGDPFTYIPPSGSGTPGYISFVDADLAGTYKFCPEWLSQMRNYAPSAGLRFLDMMETNNNGLTDWSQRPLITWDNYETPGRGAPLELLIDLANTLGYWPWFCIPVAASDDYITHHCAMVEALLKPGSRHYAELGNEFFSPFYPQNYAKTQAGIMFGDESQLFRWASRRSVEMFAVAKAASARTIRVMPSQNGSGGVTTVMLGENNAWQHTDVLATGPYFGTELVWQTTAQKTAWYNEGFPYAGLFAYMSTVDVPATIGAAQNHRNIIDTYDPNIELVGYEAGQHFYPNNTYAPQEVLVPEVMNLLINAQRSPLMKDLYNQWLTACSTLSGAVHTGFKSLCHYHNTQRDGNFGMWGLQQGLHDSVRPKWEAVQEWALAHPDYTEYLDATKSCAERYPAFVGSDLAP